jgi:hypothetical protein
MKSLNITMTKISMNNDKAVKFIVDIPFFGTISSKFLTWNKQWITDAGFEDKDGNQKRYSIVKYADEASLILAYCAVKLIKSGKNSCDIALTDDIMTTKISDFRDEDISKYLPKGNHPANAVQPKIEGLDMTNEFGN